MKINSEHLSVYKLFDDFLFTVPKYQRAYAWEDPEIDDFLDDINSCFQAQIDRSNLQHFFGGIVSVGEIQPTGKPQCALVDGQQRLATVVMFVANLISFYKSLQVADETSEFDEILEDRIKRLSNTYIQFRQESRLKFEYKHRLIMSGPDETFFRQLTSGLPAIGSIKDGATRDSHRKLQSGYSKIKNYVSSKLEKLGDIKSKLETLEQFERVLEENFTVLHMITGTPKEAYRLFQVLNDRGKNLTEGDLLRARTLEMLENFPNHQQTVIDAWNDILSDRPIDTGNFLRWYYSSVMAKRPRNNQLLDDFLEVFFPNSGDTANPSAQTLSDATKISETIMSLQSDIQKCRILLDGDWPFPIAKPITQWHRSRLEILIRELKHTNCIPLLLAACQLKPKAFSDIVLMIERFVFRYITICKAHVTPLTKVYLKHAESIRNNKDRYNVKSLQQDLHELQESRAKIAVFESALNELAYTSQGASNKPLKYFLITIENYARWYNSGKKGVPVCMDDNLQIDFASTVLEHIYPQNPDVSISDLDPYTHALGNITILGSDNEKLGNSTDFLRKRAIFKDTGLYLNKRIAEYDEWTSQVVVSRQSELVEMGKAIFSV